MENRTLTRSAALATSKPESEGTEQVRYSRANFTLLYRQYATRVYRYVFARVGNHSDAEDLIAQVFMEALQGLDRFGDRGYFAAWLFTIARNKVMDSYRRRKRLISIEQVPEMIAEKSEPLAKEVHSETADQLSALLTGLKPEQRELLPLRFAGDLRTDCCCAGENRGSDENVDPSVAALAAGSNGAEQ